MTKAGYTKDGKELNDTKWNGMRQPAYFHISLSEKHHTNSLHNIQHPTTKKLFLLYFSYDYLHTIYY